MTPNKMILTNGSKNVDIDIRSLNPVEIQILYPEIFKRIFGYFEKYHIPEIVDIAQYKNKIIGFASGRLYNKDTWNALYGGVGEKYRNIGLGAKLWLTHFKRIKNLYDINYITVRVESTNIPSLIMNLKTGFVPVGISGAKGRTYIQLTKDIRGE